MSAEPKSDRQLEIAHVLFIDIVGYSKLLMNEQSEVLQQLNQIVRNTEQFRTAEAAGKLIRIPVGDGGSKNAEEQDADQEGTIVPNP